MTASLQDQRILIVGGSSGIGLVVAKLIASKGAKLFIASRNQARLEKAAQDIGKGVNIGTLSTLDEGSVQAFFEAHDRFDHIVVFAGDSMAGGVLTSDVPTARNAVESKFWGQFYIGRYGGPKVSSNGSLVFTSGAGPRPHQVIATDVANAGVGLLAESLAKELAPVRVNVVAPYYVDTPMWSGMEDTERRQLFERVGQHLPIGRVAKPEDLAPTYLHLLTSTYITGVTIPVDGGALLQTIE